MAVVYCNDCGGAIEVPPELAARRWALCKSCGYEVNVTPPASGASGPSRTGGRLSRGKRRVRFRPRLHAAVYSPPLDSSCLPSAEKLRGRWREVARWTSPVYTIKFEPVGHHGAAQASVCTWAAGRERRARFRLGRFANPPAEYPATLALALSLSQPRLERLPCEEPELEGPVRREERRESALCDFWAAAARQLGFKADDVIVVLQLLNRGRREFLFTVLGVRTVRLSEQLQNWDAHCYARWCHNSGAPPLPQHELLSLTASPGSAVEVWWDQGPTDRSSRRR